MSNTVRVYHPTLDSWEDVPADKADQWVDAGWRKTAPKHVNTEGLPKPGETPGIAAVPVETALSSTTTTSGSGSPSSRSTRASGSSSGRGRAASGSSSSTSTSGGTSAGSTTT